MPEPTLACGWLVSMSTNPEPDEGSLLMSTLLSHVGPVSGAPTRSGADDTYADHGASPLSKLCVGCYF